jgi:uncharacterized protein YgiM (DUF1202 family)
VSCGRPRKFPVYLCAPLLFFLFLCGCKSSSGPQAEFAYVNAGQVSLRDRIAAVYNKTGLLVNGQRVEILERARAGRWLRVRNPANEEGWVEERYLTSEQVFSGFQKLQRENSAAPAQAVGITRADLNMHLEPQRDAEHLYQLKEGDKVDVLKRAVSQKPPVPALVASASKSAQAPPEPISEDWFLVRDQHRRSGWVLARMLDVDVPLEVAQYAEGQRIIADFVLNTVNDAGKPVPQYLLLLNEPRDGEPQDFNQLRVFTWNLRRHRYETAYRERNLFGVLPATVGTQDFGGKEGKLPVFTVRLRDANGNLAQREYKMNGVIVRRVLAPDEAPVTTRKPKARRG